MGRDDKSKIVDIFMDALERGDAEAAGDCLSPSALVWHSFDCQTNDRATSIEGWRQFFATTRNRRFVDVIRHEIPGGIVQQHLMVLRADGGFVGMVAALIIKIEDGKITRVDEYIEPTRELHYTEMPTRTPGF